MTVRIGIHRLSCWSAVLFLLLASLAQGFLPQQLLSRPLPFQKPNPHPPSLPTITTPSSTTTSSTQLFNKLWNRLEIEEDEEPFWYLLNCIAGLEIDLLRQCRVKCDGMEDALKFVVPTETKTRSHGPNRMVTETKVKYPGYVFGKLRLCPQVYEAVQELDLCRSWMGTVNHKGHKKLPPAPVALDDDEVENFGLEDLEFEEPEEVEHGMTDSGEAIILDDGHQKSDKNQVDEEALKVYLGFRVNDLVKVTQPGRFYDQDATVKRLKEGQLLLRFFTYGTMFEDWRDPSDVRKLTEMEILKGLSGPGQPVTQQDLERGGGRGGGGGGRDNDRGGSSGPGRQGTRTFGRGDLMSNVPGAGLRNRRQDREERGQTQHKKRDFFGRTEDDRKDEDKNWDWYKENTRSQDGVVEDGEFTYRPGSNNNNNNNNNALEDVDAQWGRPPPPSQRQQRKERNTSNNNSNNNKQDWSSFVSPSSAPPPSSSRSNEDDFFASLMNDLNKDASKSPNPSSAAAEAYGNNNDQQQQQSATTEEDDFFASLVAEISDDDASAAQKTSSPQRKESPSSLYADDFFASLAADNDQGGKSKQKKGDVFNEDDLFDSFDIVDDKEAKQSPIADDDDFFASLEQQLESVLDEDTTTTAVKPQNDFLQVADKAIANAEKVLAGDDDFFASLEESLASELQGTEDNTHISEQQPPMSSESSTSLSAREAAISPPPMSSSSPAPSSPDSSDLSKLTVPKLKEMLKARGMKVSGKKAELIDRLNA